MDRYFRRPRMAALAILVIFVFVFSGSLIYKQVVSVKAAAQPVSQSGVAAPSGTITGCTIDNIHVSTDRIHAHCTSDVSGISYFAVPAGPEYQIHANRFLTTWTTAFALNKQVDIWFEDDSASNPEGCLASNCRLATAVILK